MADKEIAVEPTSTSLALRVIGLYISICCLALFIIGNSFEFGHPTTVCFLATVAFATELTIFILINRKIVTFDDEMRKWDTIIHLIFGIICTIVAPAYMAAFICNEHQYAYIVLSTLIHFVAGCCLFAQGVIFLILGMGGQQPETKGQTLKIVAEDEPSISPSIEPAGVASVRIMEQEQPSLPAQPMDFLALRIAGIVIAPFSFTGLFISWTFEMDSDFGNPVYLCVIPITSFGLELAICLMIVLNNGILDDKMRKLETIVHLILGIFSIWISLLSTLGFCYFTKRAGFEYKWNQGTVTACILLISPAGIIYLILAYLCWTRFKAMGPVVVLDSSPTKTAPEVAEGEVKPEQPKNVPLNSGFCGILRIIVITIHLCTLLLLVFTTTMVLETFDLTCALPIGSFIYELIGFLRVHWKIRIFDDKILKSETIVHVILGAITILIGASFLINMHIPGTCGACTYLVKENHSLNKFLNQLALVLHEVAWGIVVAQGVCYLIRAFWGFCQLKKRMGKIQHQGVVRSSSSTKP